ncbi:MAG TPA: leucine-rich repeat domain-containing protein [Trebonia sp.]
MMAMAEGSRTTPGHIEAARRVREAVVTRSTELSLRGIDLDALPESLGSLTNLTTLNLGSNRLTELPEWLATGAAGSQGVNG